MVLKKEACSVGERRDVKVTLTGAVWWMVLKRSVSV
jgi:hypothetical protein